MKYIRYKSGYKYQLTEDYEDIIPIKPDESLATDYVVLNQSGYLKIRKGYAWDGPSGPTFDTGNFMRGSLVHDALYELIRKEYLPRDAKKPADRLLQEMCRQDGMSRLRAWWVYKGLQIGGDAAADPANKKRIKRAPK